MKKALFILSLLLVLAGWIVPFKVFTFRDTPPSWQPQIGGAAGDGIPLIFIYPAIIMLLANSSKRSVRIGSGILTGLAAAIYLLIFLDVQTSDSWDVALGFYFQVVAVISIYVGITLASKDEEIINSE